MNNEKKIQAFENTAIGFINIGNTCYMNSFLQIILHSPNFLNELKIFSKKHKLGNNLIENIIKLSEYPNKTEHLFFIKDYMKNVSYDYGSYTQNDSQEFGKDLINEIINEIKRILNISYEYSDSERDVYSKYTKKIKYKNFIDKYQNNEINIEKMFTINEIEEFWDKTNKDYIFNTSFDIELIFPKSQTKKIYKLNELLDYKYDNKDLNLGKKSNKTKICKLPDILIITIIRSLIGKKYINYPLLIPKELCLENYIDKELLYNNKEKSKYDLYAINKKYGNSYKAGHYFCCIKIGKNWFNFEDNQINLSSFDQEKTSSNVIGLFYIKKNKIS